MCAQDTESVLTITHVIVLIIMLVMTVLFQFVLEFLETAVKYVQEMESV